MNTPESTKESEFIFRRLSESFVQFAMDLWHSVPLWLLVLACAALLAKVGYNRHIRRTRGPGKPNVVQRRLWWLAFITTSALVVHVLFSLYRRDSEQIRSGSTPLTAFGTSNDAMWYAFIAGIFGLGCVFVIWMYIKDSRSIRWYWAAKLAMLRMAVYAILCFVFLLPAIQTKDRSERRSRVVVVLDISPSMTRVSDEMESRGHKAKTRMDVLIEFLTDDNVKWIQKLLEKNPVMVYSLGSRLDEAPATINRDDRPWSKDEWEGFVAYDFRPFLLKGLDEPAKEMLQRTTVPVDWNGPKLANAQQKLEPTNWADWAAAWQGFAKQVEPGNEENWKTLVNGMAPKDDKILRENITKLDRRIEVARTIALGTNVPDSITAAVNRESPNMVQGIIVFSDGRSNLGSDSAFRELRDRATKEKIPVFTVGVGEEREVKSIAITDIQADETAQPDQGFKVVVEADGVNLAGKTADVVLDLFYLGADAKEPDGKLKELKGRTPDFTFSADTNPKKAPYQITFASGDLPHGQMEFEIDPVKLSQHPLGAKLTEESKDAAIKKPVLKEGQWAVRARIPKHPEEVFSEAEHIRDRMGIQVIQKKLRVLLIAGSASREFQFLRTFLVREVQDSRATVTVLVQNEAGTSGNLTPNPTEEIISRFPNKLDLTDAKVDPKEKPYNLNEYDVVVAFDPDWSEVTLQQAEDLQTWVQRQGGGLIYVADRINTFQLIRKGTEAGSPLNPVLDILPVIPDDIVAVKIAATGRTPRRLMMHPIPGSDLLKIDERPSEKDDGQSQHDPIAGWERFFTDRDKYVQHLDAKVEYFPTRGFYSSYPVKQVKAGSHILAEFASIDERGEVSLRPWLVTNNPSAAWRTCYVGSGEIYRLQQYDEKLGKEFYERYWGKLLKYMAAKRNVKASRGRVLVSKDYISGTTIRVQAQILNTTSKPYPSSGAGSIDPKFTITRLTPNGEKSIVEGAIPMTAKTASSEFEGYYVGQIMADPKKFPAGDSEYFVEIDVPDSPGDKLRGQFLIVKSDPEMDNTRPDLTAMLNMAGDFDSAFQDRIPGTVKDQFKRSLPKVGGTQKLSFQLSDPAMLKLIPECFETKNVRQEIKGPVTDIWDRGIEIEFPVRSEEGNFIERIVPRDLSGRKSSLSLVLLIVIGLLCWEWLTRKLLRLA